MSTNVPIGGEKRDPISPTRRRRPSDGTRDPTRTRANLLDAAYREFAASGYHGASIERICRRAGVSKQVLSHHFGSKERVYLKVLEAAYEASRSRDLEITLDLLAPAEAMKRLVGFAFDHLRDNRAFVRLLTDENIHKGRHIAQSEAVRDSYRPLIERLGTILRQGEREGSFRSGLDPYQLYISISGLCFFYFSNAYTLGAALDREMLSADAIAARRQHVIDFVMSAVTLPRDLTTQV